jgi:hypothetical protein
MVRKTQSPSTLTSDGVPRFVRSRLETSKVQDKMHSSLEDKVRLYKKGETSTKVSTAEPVIDNFGSTYLTRSPVLAFLDDDDTYLDFPWVLFVVHAMHRTSQMLTSE